MIETGDKIVADGRLFSSNDLSVDESALTGESLPVKKDAEFVCQKSTPVAERANMLYSGCFVSAGNGQMLVTGVGNDTEFGQIAQELSSIEKTTTPLQEKLDKLGKQITVLGASAAAIVFASFPGIEYYQDVKGKCTGQKNDRMRDDWMCQYHLFR